MARVALSKSFDWRTLTTKLDQFVDSKIITGIHSINDGVSIHMGGLTVRANRPLKEILAEVAAIDGVNDLKRIPCKQETWIHHHRPIGHGNSRLIEVGKQRFKQVGTAADVLALGTP